MPAAVFPYESLSTPMSGFVPRFPVESTTTTAALAGSETVDP